MSSYIAVQDLNSAAAGATVWWELTGTVNHSVLAEEWDGAGLPEAFRPQPPSPAQVLKRALVAVVGREQLIRPLRERGAYAVVREQLNGGDKTAAKLRYTTVCKVWVDEDGALQFVGETDEDLTLLQDTIAAEYANHAGRMNHSDIGGWLVDTAKAYVHAVGLRRMGGMYFIAADELDAWNEVVEILADAGSRSTVYQMPTLRSENALQAIHDAVVGEAERKAAEIIESLAEGDLGKRALRNRTADCEAMLAKLQAYEGLLGDRLVAIQARVRETKTAVTAADLARKAQRDARKAKGK